MRILAAAMPLLLLLTVGYLALCLASPFKRCPRCNGIGHQLKTDRKGRPTRGKPCRHCDTTGLRIRYGRHLLNLARTRRNAAIRADRTPARRTPRA